MKQLKNLMNARRDKIERRSSRSYTNFEKDLKDIYTSKREEDTITRVNMKKVVKD